nr:MAG TPA: hypothetical protein [Bacteriophage sp.]
MNNQTKIYILLFAIILNILLIGYSFNYRPAVGMVVFVLAILIWSYFPYDKYFNKWNKRKEE